jgi:hypothetical protein
LERRHSAFTLIELLTQERTEEVFDLINANGDDVVTIGEIRAFQPRLDEQPISLERLWRPLALDAGNQDPSRIPGVLLEQVLAEREMPTRHQPRKPGRTIREP